MSEQYATTAAIYGSFNELLLPGYCRLRVDAILYYPLRSELAASETKTTQ